MDRQPGTASNIFRWLLCLFDALTGGLLTFGGLFGISKLPASWDWFLLVLCVAALGCGLTLLLAAWSLAEFRPPRCWKIGAYTHAFAASSLGLSTAAIFMWSSLVESERQLRSPGFGPYYNHMTGNRLESLFESLLVFCGGGPALISLVATIILIALARTKLPGTAPPKV